MAVKRSYRKVAMRWPLIEWIIGDSYTGAKRPSGTLLPRSRAPVPWPSAFGDGGDAAADATVDQPLRSVACGRRC
jgi:hypothetical protein